MLAEGVLSVTGKRPDAAYAIHVLSSEAAGTWSTKSGPLLAGSLNLTITVTGRGGHGSMPYASIDPVPVAAEIVLALQSYLNSIEQLRNDLPRLADGICDAHGCTAETQLQIDLPVTVNDPAETAFVLAELTSLYGTDRVAVLSEPRMGSEDFSFVLDEVPGAFIFLGAHPDPLPETPPTNHSARAVFDDAVLSEQAATLAHLAYTKITTLAAKQQDRP